MKKVAFIFILFLASISFVNGQGRMGTPEERAQRQAAQLETRLKLSGDQKTKVYEILFNQAKTVDSLRKGGSDFQAMRPKLREMQEESNKKISDLLNEDQKKTYATYLEERRNRMQNGQGGQQRRRNNSGNQE